MINKGFCWKDEMMEIIFIGFMEEYYKMMWVKAKNGIVTKQLRIFDEGNISIRSMRSEISSNEEGGNE